MNTALIVYGIFMIIGILFWIGATRKETPKQEETNEGEFVNITNWNTGIPHIKTTETNYKKPYLIIGVIGVVIIVALIWLI